VVAVTRKLAEHSFAQTTFVLKYDRTTEVGFTSLSGKHWPVIAYGEETSMYGGTDIAYGEETSMYGGTDIAYGEETSLYGGTDIAYGEETSLYGGTDIAYGEETSMYGGSLKECLMCVISNMM